MLSLFPPPFNVALEYIVGDSWSQAFVVLFLLGVALHFFFNVWSLPWVHNRGVGDVRTLQLPRWMYDLIASFFWPLNFSIWMACYLQIEKAEESEWDDIRLPKGPSSAERLETVKRDILAGLDCAHSQTDLIRLFDSLPR